MKYLKYFESNDITSEEFTRLNLSYLLDENDFVIKTSIKERTDVFVDNNSPDINYITIEKKNINKIVSWDDIKSEIVPYIEMLDKKYKMYSFRWEYNCNKDGVIYINGNIYSIDDIVSDRIEIDNIVAIKVKTTVYSR